MGCPFLVARNQAQDEWKQIASGSEELAEKCQNTSGEERRRRASRTKGGRCGTWALAMRAPRGHTCRPPKNTARGGPARGAHPSAERHGRNGQKLEGHRRDGVGGPPTKTRGVPLGVVRSSNVGRVRDAVVLDTRL